MNQEPDEIFAGNKHINAELHEMFSSPLFSEMSKRRMRKKIREARDACRKHGTQDADASARHIFREFLPAHRLNEQGFRLEYEASVGGKTPDWYDSSKKLVLEVFTCERGGRSDLRTRIAKGIEEKVSKYEALVPENCSSIVVAVYGDFETGLDADDCQKAIDDAQLFQRLPILGGVLFFSETTARKLVHDDGSPRFIQEYGFSFLGNPSALHTVALQSNLG